MELILKIAAVGLIVAVIHQILCKIGRDEYAMFTMLGGVVAIIMMLIPEIMKLVETVQTMFPV